MRKKLREGLMFLVAVVLLCIGFYWLQVEPKRTSALLKLTAGDESGLRHRLAVEFAREAASHGINIVVEPMSGSEAAMQGVNDGEFDLAFVQGGLSNSGLRSVRQLTSMHIEPLHLLVKSALHERILKLGLGQLAGCTVNLGPAGGGTNVLASEVLRFAGLEASVDGADSSHNNPPLGNPSLGDTESYQAVSFSYSELQSMPTERLPDAIFTVSSLPSPIADYLIESQDFRLVSLPFGEALSLEAFLQLGELLPNASIDKRHVFETQIPAFTYSVTRAEPPQSLSTVGTRLLLVANERVPSEIVSLLLESLYNSNFAHAERPPLDASLLDLPAQYPMHIGSVHYRQRNKPLIAGDAIDYWEKVLAIAATLCGGTFFLVQWYLRLRRRQRESNFATYMNRVLAIEASAMQNEFSAQLDLSQLMQLQRELAELKSEAVSKFAAGELEGEGLVHGFLALVNDARSQLTRLILHQRDNVEEQAALQQDAIQQLWPSPSKLD